MFYYFNLHLLLFKKYNIFAMDIIFDDKKLEKLANDWAKCQKAMGNTRAKLYHKRLNELRAAETLEDVRHLPGHYHELKSNRKGEWACNLDQPYRLIFVPQEVPIPTDTHGKYLWPEIKGIKIVEITDYHEK
jgi:proteic killer suppression protein